jgi:DNA-binding transcriptional ArsR family regulator
VSEILSAIQALGDPTRYAVFECIRGCCGGATGYDTETGQCDAGEPGAICLCDVKCQVPCAPSTLTHHLNALRDAGLIVTEKRGRMVYASVVPARLEEISSYFASRTAVCV